MFEIQYKILDESNEELKNITGTEFESEYDDIIGQFQLKLGEHRFGFVSDDIPFGNERILLWFGLLFDVVEALNNNGYAALNLVGSHNSWIEFVVKEEGIGISELKVPQLDGYNPFVLTVRPNIERVVWEDLIVKRQDFINELHTKSKKLLSDLMEINHQLLGTRKVSRISNETLRN